MNFYLFIKSKLNKVPSQLGAKAKLRFQINYLPVAFTFGCANELLGFWDINIQTFHRALVLVIRPYHN